MNPLKHSVLKYSFSLLLVFGLINSIAAQLNPTFTIAHLDTQSEPFDVQLGIEKINATQYKLSVAVELQDGDYIISPYSNDSFYSKFSISTKVEKQFEVRGALIEFPVAREEYDPIIEEQVKFVRSSTVYQQILDDVSNDDFEVSGVVEFLLEPSCVPYDIEFVISNRSGELEIEKTNTVISKEYKLK